LASQPKTRKTKNSAEYFNSAEYLKFWTLREKIMSLDDIVLVEENDDDSPSTDDEESVA
jgi:hypothetical protein